MKTLLFTLSLTFLITGCNAPNAITSYSGKPSNNPIIENVPAVIKAETIGTQAKATIVLTDNLQQDLAIEIPDTDHVNYTYNGTIDLTITQTVQLSFANKEALKENIEVTQSTQNVLVAVEKRYAGQLDSFGRTFVFRRLKNSDYYTLVMTPEKLQVLSIELQKNYIDVRNEIVRRFLNGETDVATMVSQIKTM